MTSTKGDLTALKTDRDRRKNGGLTWVQFFGDFTQKVINGLKQWFPQDAVNIGQLQSVLARHYERQVAGLLRAPSALLEFTLENVKVELNDNNNSSIGTSDVAHYIKTGEWLKTYTDSGMTEIEEGVTQFVNAVQHRNRHLIASVFAYLYGSSGLGKTQLAFALKRKVLYIPLGDNKSQLIYRHFNTITQALLGAISLDMAALRAVNPNISNECAFSTDNIAVIGGVDNFTTVGVLLRLLKLASYESFWSVAVSNVFLGADGRQVISAMSLAAGRQEAKKYRDVLIYLDEIPEFSKNNTEPYYQCLFLRNLIRCLFLPCLLSGSESTLMGAREVLSGSRCDGYIPWVWLLTKFPRGSRYHQKKEEELPIAHTHRHISDFETELLNKTRPLFVNWFIQCCNPPPISTADAAVNDAQTAVQPRLLMTPESLSQMKDTICSAKCAPMYEEDDRDWLHASLLMVFAHSFETSGGGGVVSAWATSMHRSSASSSASSSNGTNNSGDSSHLVASPSIGMKRKRWESKTEGDNYHSILIRKHFGLLHIPAEVVPVENKAIPVVELHMNLDCRASLHTVSGSMLRVKAVFKTCSEDPLLYLACLRDGIKRRHQEGFIKVPSTYVYSSYREQKTSVRHSIFAVSNDDGLDLEREGIAACVLASHCYTTFDGTPFFDWLGLMIAELSPDIDFAVDTHITHIPAELSKALASVIVPILSAVNCPWGDACSQQTDINFGNMSWCVKNKEEEEDGQVTATLISSSEMSSSAAQGQQKKSVERGFGRFPLTHSDGGHYRHLDLDFIHKSNLEEEEEEEEEEEDGLVGGVNATITAAAVNHMMGGGLNHICLLISADLSKDWTRDTVKKFDGDKNLSVYRMISANTIERVTAEVPEASWEEAGRKVVIVVDLKAIYSERN